MTGDAATAVEIALPPTGGPVLTLFADLDEASRSRPDEFQVMTRDLAGSGVAKLDGTGRVVAIADGNTVLVDVTATWCLTCKVNELRVLENAEIRSRFQQSHVIRMRADWSRPNPLIGDYLHRFGRYGIPFDVVYGPGRPQGEALPELLTTSAHLHAIDRASIRDYNRKSAESAP